jgi:hypothetical protein
VAGSYKHGNEPSGSIKDGEFLDQLTERLSASQEGLCSVELVNKHFVSFCFGHKRKTKRSNKIQNTTQAAFQASSMFLLVDRIQGRHGVRCWSDRSRHVHSRNLKGSRPAPLKWKRTTT